jgi:hypothetical protein
VNYLIEPKEKTQKNPATAGQKNEKRKQFLKA